MEHTPTSRIADAVRISMSIPLFFAAFRNIRNDVYVDGGLLNNFPVKLFDLSETMKTKLEQSGRMGASTYFDWFDKKASNPANRP